MVFKCNLTYLTISRYRIQVLDRKTITSMLISFVTSLNTENIYNTFHYVPFCSGKSLNSPPSRFFKGLHSVSLLMSATRDAGSPATLSVEATAFVLESSSTLPQSKELV